MRDSANPLRRLIYLDNHATTSVDERVAGIVLETMTTNFGNANGRAHGFGEAAGRLVETARRQVADLVAAAAEDVIFTPFASDALRLALAFAAADYQTPLRVTLAPIEHPALLEAVEVAERDGQVIAKWLDVDTQGQVRLDSISDCLDRGTDLLCLMAANNEVGTVQPVEEAGRLAFAAGCLFLVDASQSAHWLPEQAARSGADFLVLCAHKMHGPKGVGALIAQGRARAPRPAGWRHHESTPNTPAIAGMGEACQIAKAQAPADRIRIAALRDRLQILLEEALPGLAINGDQASRLPNNLHISIPDADNDAVVAQLRDTVAVSTGAACRSGTDAPSHVLSAMKLPRWRLDGALRIGLGRFTQADDIDKAAGLIIQAVRAAQHYSRNRP